MRGSMLLRQHLRWRLDYEKHGYDGGAGGERSHA